MCEMISAAGVPTSNRRREAESAEGSSAAGAGLAVQREKVHIRRTRREGCQQGMRSAHAARSAKRCSRRVSGGWVGGIPCAPGGWWSAACETRVRGERCTAHRPSVYRNEKG